MMEVLLWFDRFDLDAKQISTRSLRSLVENKRMPLRRLHRVEYDETDADVEKVASYLSSCVVSDFKVYAHMWALPINAVFAAPDLIDRLCFNSTIFQRKRWVPSESLQGNTLSKTLKGSTFKRLVLLYSHIPDLTIDDQQLESIRLCGCNVLHVYLYTVGPDLENDFKATEEGILGYCFTLDDELPVPEKRTLRFSKARVTPTFFIKLVEVTLLGLRQRMACVELSLGDLWFDVANLDVGVLPERSEGPTDDPFFPRSHDVAYDLADHGNGVRLLIHFRSTSGTDWKVIVRHGKKEHEEFFKSTPQWW